MEARELYEKIAAEVTDGQEVISSQMFGMPTLKVRGKAFAGLHGEVMAFKLAPDDLVAAQGMPGAGNFDPSGMGRVMGGWVQVGADGQKEWKRLAEQALAFVGASAPKKK